MPPKTTIVELPTLPLYQGVLITSEIPKSWAGLEEMTQMILGQCGFAQKSRIATPRSPVEVDVMSVQDQYGRLSTSIFECKFHKRPITQNVVHALRAVMNDIGANAGFIISLSGFQKGAYQACTNTNIRLLSWQDFQIEFSRQWRTIFFSDFTSKALDPLTTMLAYLDLLSINREFLQGDELQDLDALISRYSGLKELIYDLTNPNSYIELPIRATKKYNSIQFDQVLDASALIDIGAAIISVAPDLSRDVGLLAEKLWLRGDIFQDDEIFANDLRDGLAYYTHQRSEGDRRRRGVIPCSLFSRSDDIDLLSDFAIRSSLEFRIASRVASIGEEDFGLCLMLGKSLVGALVQEIRVNGGCLDITLLKSKIMLSAIRDMADGNGPICLPLATRRPLLKYFEELARLRHGRVDEAHRFLSDHVINAVHGDWQKQL